jgi:hypothetical protein
VYTLSLCLVFILYGLLNLLCNLLGPFGCVFWVGGHTRSFTLNENSCFVFLFAMDNMRSLEIFMLFLIISSVFSSMQLVFGVQVSLFIASSGDIITAKERLLFISSVEIGRIWGHGFWSMALPILSLPCSV